MRSLTKCICVMLLWGLSFTGTSAQNLSRGMSGDAVTALQTALAGAGYFALTADGAYGSATVKAVSLFQSDKGLSVTGVADDDTQEAIRRSVGKGYRPGGGVVMAEGNQGDLVAEYQRKLQNAGYLSGAADGIYGPDMAEAVKRLQREQGIPISGVIDEETLAWLSSVGQNNNRTPVPRGDIMMPGSSGGQVAKLQNLLLLHGYNPGTADGIYGAATADAVRMLQERYGLRETGNADAQVWNVLRGAPEFSGNYRKSLVMRATAYTPYDPGNTGYTAGGSLAGKGHVAVDPSVIPLGSMVFIQGYGYAIADDIGGSVTGRVIDVGVDSQEQAYQWGNREVQVYVVS